LSFFGYYCAIVYSIIMSCGVVHLTVFYDMTKFDSVSLVTFWWKRFSWSNSLWLNFLDWLHGLLHFILITFYFLFINFLL